MKPELVVQHPCRLGEAPLWHPAEGCLYWSDIPAGQLHRYHPTTGRHELILIGPAVGGLTLQADGQLLLFMAAGAIRPWQGRFTGTVHASLPDELDNRFNDVIADPAGRVFCGVLTTARRPGRLYRLDPDGAITPVIEGTGTANGMAFTPDHHTFFFTDTRRYTIDRFDYDPATGRIDNRRPFIEVPRDGQGRPDGLTLDADGCFWSARYDGGCIVRYDPAGREMARFPLPVRNVTSLTFGGDRRRDLYITTAGGSGTGGPADLAGSLFCLPDIAPGRPEYRSTIRSQP